jgi:hypothetical protein
MSEHPPLCEHVRRHTWPFCIELVIDEQAGFTDALVRCRSCAQACLLEMLDWRGAQRLMRVSVLDEARAAGMLRSVSRGSCDVRRGTAELQHLQTTSPFSRWLLVVDSREPRIDDLVPVPPDVRLPGASWRELACDGSWFEGVAAQDQTPAARVAGTEESR